MPRGFSYHLTLVEGEDTARTSNGEKGEWRQRALCAAASSWCGSMGARWQEVERECSGEEKKLYRLRFGSGESIEGEDRGAQGHYGLNGHE